MLESHLFAPNSPDKEFWHALMEFLGSRTPGDLIIGGDFNATLCTAVDRSGTGAPIPQDQAFSSFHLSGYKINISKSE
uniref:Endonuclease/exonuclease/phosphatase domain-containing protein n=1 Tax=Leptobrachium leishanense TaxID=445787 RepID=A0A8C5M8G4_9ANUR